MRAKCSFIEDRAARLLHTERCALICVFCCSHLCHILSFFHTLQPTVYFLLELPVSLRFLFAQCVFIVQYETASNSFDHGLSLDVLSFISPRPNSYSSLHI